MAQSLCREGATKPKACKKAVAGLPQNLTTLTYNWYGKKRQAIKNIRRVKYDTPLIACPALLEKHKKAFWADCQAVSFVAESIS